MNFQKLDSKIYRFDNFLNQEQCQEYINFINKSIQNENQICFSNSADSINHKYVDLDLAQKFYNRIMEYNLDCNILRPNNLIMWAKYLPGSKFGLHTDTGLYYDHINKEKSTWTLLIYLNDDFDGGSTVFYNDDFKENVSVKPVKILKIYF